MSGLPTRRLLLWVGSSHTPAGVLRTFVCTVLHGYAEHCNGRPQVALMSQSLTTQYELRTRGSWVRIRRARQIFKGLQKCRPLSHCPRASRKAFVSGKVGRHISRTSAYAGAQLAGQTRWTWLLVQNASRAPRRVQPHLGYTLHPAHQPDRPSAGTLRTARRRRHGSLSNGRFLCMSSSSCSSHSKLPLESPIAMV